MVLGPARWPRDALALALFGLSALRSAAVLARGHFEAPRARALFAGLAAHSGIPLERPGSAAIGLVLGIAGHAGGWPIPAGGAQSIADALAGHLRSLGGAIEVSARVASLRDLPPARAVLCDLTPRQLLQVAGDALSQGDRRRLRRFRYGAGAYKPWALAGPIPWRAPECRRAATVHLGGTLEEIAEAERAPLEGRAHPRPFVLLAQPSLFDPARASVTVVPEAGLSVVPLSACVRPSSPGLWALWGRHQREAELLDSPRGSTSPQAFASLGTTGTGKRDHRQ